MSLDALETALLEVCESGNVELLRRVCASNRELLATTFGSERDTIAHIAAFYGHGPILQLIHQTCPMLLSSVTADERAPAHEAAAAGSVATIILLAQLGAVDSLLMPGVVRTAAAGGHVDVLRALVVATSGKVDLVDASSDNFTSGHTATACGHVEAVLFLHELRRDSLHASTRAHGWTCAHMAACTGDLKCLSLLGRLGLPLDCYSYAQWPACATVRPFQIACRTSIACTMHLAVHGVDTSTTVPIGHVEAEKHGEDVTHFLELLQGKARLLSALLRLTFKVATQYNASVVLCDDLVEEVGQLLTPARIARAYYTADQMQSATACLEETLARRPSNTAEGDHASRKRRCTTQR